MLERRAVHLSPVEWYGWTRGVSLAQAGHEWDNVICEQQRNVYRGMTPMSLSRGNFVLKCDHPDCDREIDLETTDFTAARRASDQYKDDENWSIIRRGDQYADICGDH